MMNPSNSFVPQRPTITVGEQVYSFGRLSALAQFHVLRRVMPVMSKVVPTLMKLAATKDKDERLKLLLENMEPFAEMLAKLSDEDANYVIRECLKVCASVHSGGHMPVTTPDGTLTDAYMSMPAMIRLTMKVVDQHMADFFALLRGATAA